MTNTTEIIAFEEHLHARVVCAVTVLAYHLAESGRVDTVRLYRRLQTGRIQLDYRQLRDTDWLVTKLKPGRGIIIPPEELPSCHL